MVLACRGLTPSCRPRQFPRTRSLFTQHPYFSTAARCRPDGTKAPGLRRACSWAGPRACAARSLRSLARPRTPPKSLRPAAALRGGPWNRGGLCQAADRPRLSLHPRRASHSAAGSLRLQRKGGYRPLAVRPPLSLFAPPPGPPGGGDGFAANDGGSTPPHADRPPGSARSPSRFARFHRLAAPARGPTDVTDSRLRKSTVRATLRPVARPVRPAVTEAGGVPPQTPPGPRRATP